MSAVQCGLFLLLLLASSAPSVVLGQSSCKACAAGAVKVENGAYYNILVVVENGVSYDPNIVPNIQDYFESASEALFTATKDHSGRYFGEVTILVPEYWPEIDTIPATTEAANKATFSVRPDTPEWGSNPYTIRVISECGAPGQVTVLPESFTNNKAEAEKYGPNVGKTIVHEWAHLRYGLFDESAWEDGGDTFPCGSIQDSGQVPRCSAAIEGTAAQAEESGMCVFVPDVNNQTAAASLLYAPYLASVEHFCDDDGLVQDSGLIHNAFALNEQNTRCQLRSAWSVMRDHPDFASGVEGATTLEPVKFRVVRDNTLRISIVMDVSGSMNTLDRITWMHQSVENFLQSLLKASTTNEVPIMVGLSKFSSQAQQIHELVLINDTTIDSLVSVIPSVTEGATSIGAGIRKGLEVLGTPGLRSMLVVFTDGLQNTLPNIEDVEEEVCEFNATVYGMIVSNVANNHPLIRLSEATCGGSCIVEDTSQTTIYDCLWSALKERVPQLAPLQLVADVVNVPQQTNLTDSVMVDSIFTNDVVFRFEWPARVATGGKCDLLEVEIVTPGGVIMLSADYNPTATRIEIPGSSNTVGEWFYTVMNPSSTDCDVRVTIEGDTNNMTYADQPAQISVATSKTNLTLNASASVQSNTVAIYVTVTKGTTPVIGADVTAIVTLGSTNWIVDLLDNGASADVKKNDGIYSRYFINYNANGAYSIRVEVLGLNGKVKLNKQTRSYAQPAPPLPQYRVLGVTSTNVPTEAFQRSAVGGLIEISGYDPLTTSAAALYPPSQIADLVTALADTSSSSVTIMWTAVGAYLDQGNVSSYDIRLSLDPVELIKSFDSAFQLTSDMVVSGSSLILPLAAGLAEQMMLNLNNTNFTSPDVKVFIAIVAINAAGRRSPVSNLGQFYFVPVAMPEEPEPVPTTSNDSFPGWAIALIVIGCAMFIVLVVIATVLVYKKTHQKVKYTGNENTYVNGPGVYMSPPAYEGPQSSRINDEKV